MYIESKLKEFEKTLFSIDVSEESHQNILQQEVVKYSIQWLKTNSKIQFTKGLFIIEANFDNIRELTDIFSISGEYIQISYLGKGDSQLISSKEEKPVGMGCVNCCYDRDTVTTIKMPANIPTHYQALFLSKEYYLKLFTNEGWVVENSFHRKVKNGEFLKFGAYKFPIDYNLYHILKGSLYFWMKIIGHNNNCSLKMDEENYHYRENF